MRNAIIVIVLSAVLGVFALVTYQVLSLMGFEGMQGMLMTASLSVAMGCILGLLLLLRVYGSGDNSSRKEYSTQNLPGMGRFGGAGAGVPQRPSDVVHLASESSPSEYREKSKKELQEQAELARKEKEKRVKEEQFAAFQSMLSSKNREAQESGPAEDASPEPGSKSTASGGDPGELRNRLVVRKTEIEGLIAQSNKYLAKIDSYMMKNMPKNTTGSINAVVDVRRILDALKVRLEEIDHVLEAPQIEDLDYGQSLLTAEIRFDENNMNALIDSRPLPPLKPKDWQPTLTSLFKRISHRRSIFKAKRFHIPPE